MNSEQQFKIEWANQSDLPSVYAINEFFSDKEYSHTKSFFEEGIVAKRLAIAFCDSKPAGYVIYQVLWGNTPFVALLRVLSVFQGKGLGKMLMEMVEEKMRSEGYAALISSSEEVNDGGKAFHEKMGFERIGTLDMIFGEEIFFKKKL